MTDGQYLYTAAVIGFAVGVVLEHLYIKWRNRR